MPKLNLKILRMGAEDLTYECDMAIFPGIEGKIGVMHDHTRFATPLRKGQIRIQNGEAEDSFDIEKGFLVVTKKAANVLLG